MTIRTVFFFSLMLGFLPCIPAQAASDNPKCEPNPVFKGFAGEFMDNCDRARFKDLELWRWKKAGDPKSGSAAFKVEGEYWYYFNGIEKDAKGLHPGKLEVQRNFESAVRQAKGEILSTDSKSVTYRIRKGNDEFWGVVGCGRGGPNDCSAVSHKIVRVAAMEQSVVVSSEQIAKSILDEGKAVFYGLYFDTDKAVLKPESAPTLVEMAKWLKSNPANKVYIVGHTDMQGAAGYNLSLSKTRGAAVVEALIKQHGINRERLLGEGAGSLAPISNNTSEAGRAKNRRVEMVLR